VLLCDKRSNAAACKDKLQAAVWILKLICCGSSILLITSRTNSACVPAPGFAEDSRLSFGEIPGVGELTTSVCYGMEVCKQLRMRTRERLRPWVNHKQAEAIREFFRAKSRRG